MNEPAEFETKAEINLKNPYDALCFLNKANADENPKFLAEIFFAHRQNKNFFMNPLKQNNDFSQARKLLAKVALNSKGAALLLLNSRYENTMKGFLKPLEIAQIILKHLQIKGFSSKLSEIYRQTLGLSIVERIFDLVTEDKAILETLATNSYFLQYFEREATKFEADGIKSKLLNIKESIDQSNKALIDAINIFLKLIPEEKNNNSNSNTFETNNKRKYSMEDLPTVKFHPQTRSRRLHNSLESNSLSQHSQVSQTDFDETKQSLQKIKK